MSVLAFLSAALATGTPQWSVDMIWGCRIVENGRSPYLIQGRLLSANAGGESRQHAMHMLKDEGGRLEGYVASSPNYVNPRPGEHWVIRGRPHDAGLILLLPGKAGQSSARLMLAGAKEPAGRGQCQIKEKP